MATLTRPDVYINETLTSPTPSFFPAASPGVFVGYAPRGPLVPTQIDSWRTFVKLYGSFIGGSADDLAVAVYEYFLNGGASCYVLRVVGAGGAAATRTLNDRKGVPGAALVVSAANVGIWGNQIYVEITDTGVTGRFNLNVRVGGTADSYLVEQFTDLSINPADPRYVNNIVNNTTPNAGGSNVISVAAPNAWTYLDNTSTPAASTTPGGDVLAGGSDPAAPTLGATGSYANGLAQLDSIQSQMLLNLVDVTDSATINAAITYAAGRKDTVVIVDCQFNRTSGQAATDAAAFTASSFAATYWPPLYISDPSSAVANASRKVAPSALVMGVISTVDRQRGAWRAPAGAAWPLAGVLGLEGVQSATDWTTVAGAFVNAIRYFPQTGFAIWGSHTLKPNQADAQLSCRRTLISIEAAITAVMRQYQFEDNDSFLWGEVGDQITNVLRQVWQGGGLRGDNATDAFYVVCDETNNTDVTVAAGELHVEVGVALQFPAQFIVINVGQYDGTTIQTSNSLAA